MTKKLLDICKLNEDLEQNNEEVEGIICYRHISSDNFGNFEITLDNEKLNPYWVEVED